MTTPRSLTSHARSCSHALVCEKRGVFASRRREQSRIASSSSHVGIAAAALTCSVSELKDRKMLRAQPARSQSTQNERPPHRNNVAQRAGEARAHRKLPLG